MTTVISGFTVTVVTGNTNLKIKSGLVLFTFIYTDS